MDPKAKSIVKTTAFLPLDMPSHYNICFSLAKHLQANGEQVVFLCKKSLVKYVSEEGFKCYEFDYYKFRIFGTSKTCLSYAIISRLDKNFLRKNYKYFLNYNYYLKELTGKLNIDTLYIDEHINFYYILFYKLANKIVFFNTKFPTGEAINVAPLSSKILPKFMPLYNIISFFLWKKIYIENKVNDIFRNIILTKSNEYNFIKRMATKKNLNYNKLISQKNAFYSKIISVDTINLVPKQLDYPWAIEKKNEIFWYRPYKSCRKSNFIEDNQILFESNNPLIYVSLGTLVDNCENIVANFISLIIEVAKEKKLYNFIISTGNNLYKKYANLEIDNVYFFNNVPQTLILKKCDLMILHGGTNSIIECIEAVVPVISYPLLPRIDHNGNTARIMFHKIGLRGNIRNETVHELKSKIEILLNDPSYTRRIFTLKKSFKHGQYQDLKRIG